MTDTKHNTPWTAKRIGDSNFWRIRDANEKLVTQGISEYYAKITLDHVNNYAPLVEALEMVLEVHGDEECVHDHHGTCQTHNMRRNADGDPECQVAMARKALATAKGARDDAE